MYANSLTHLVSFHGSGGAMLYIPGGLWEFIAFPLWLFFRGFNSYAHICHKGPDITALGLNSNKTGEKRMNACLILIDIQNDYFDGGKMELVNIKQAAENAKKLLGEFRCRHLPVIHIQHVSTRLDATFFLPDTTGVEINELVSPLEGEKVVKKNYPNSFRETELLEILRKNEKDTVIICGAMSHMCIDATTRAAFDYGFKCVVVEDACATRDLLFKDQTITAANVHASFMAALSVPYALVLSTEETLKRLS